MNLFAYGTLMWPEVQESVPDLRMIGSKAVLDDYTRRRGERYPVVIPSLEDSEEGILYPGLPEQSFQALDIFEGETYNRVEIDFRWCAGFCLCAFR